jgi:LacI family transcriptional regulator
MDVADGPPRVMRKDVAARAGVSEATVSYAMSGGPVSATTAARVRAIAAEMGYRPNASARALKLGHSGILGIVVDDRRNPFFSEMANAVDVAARRRGLAVIAAEDLEDADAARRQTEWLASRNVEGILITTQLTRKLVDELDDLAVPWVALNQIGPIAGARAITVDLAAGAELVVAHLASHRRRRIAFFGDTSGRDGRHLGWQRALSATAHAGPAVQVGFDLEAGYRAALEVFGGAPPPDALFASSDLMAVAAMRGIRELGLRVPEDVAVAGFDGTWLSEYSSPTLTAYRQPIREMAEEAVRLVTAPAEQRPIGYLQFAGELLLRQSCGCGANPTQRE